MYSEAVKTPNSLEEKLLSVATFRRRDFFKLWNQIQNSEFAYSDLATKVTMILEQMEDLEVAKVPPMVKFVSMLSPSYPTILLELPQPPIGLFIRGEFSEGPYVGIVGSRKPTPYAQRTTRDVARVWASKGLTVVSGGAYGIDGIAHEGALQVGGKTMVILGSGFHHLYPKAHIRLFEEVVKRGGCLVTEYPAHFEAKPYHFPERNRIIACLSDSLFLAQAHEKSGSLLTAKTALDMGREIFVLRPIPGDASFLGSQDLIDSGAHSLIDARELETFF